MGSLFRAIHFNSLRAASRPGDPGPGRDPCDSHELCDRGRCRPCFPSRALHFLGCRKTSQAVAGLSALICRVGDAPWLSAAQPVHDGRNECVESCEVSILRRRILPSVVRFNVLVHTLEITPVGSSDWPNGRRRRARKNVPIWRRLARSRRWRSARFGRRMAVQVSNR